MKALASAEEAGVVLLGGVAVPYVVMRSRKRTRTIALRIEPEQTLRILAPLRTKRAVIEAMLTRRGVWIRERMADLQKRMEARPIVSFRDGDCFLFKGETLRLRLSQDPHRPSACWSDDVGLHVNIPEPDLSPQALCAEVRFETKLWYKKQARKECEERIAFWNQQTKIQHRHLLMSQPEKRWGSCDGQDVIRINWQLIRAAPRLIDYVLLHELCHVVHKNHSPAFWRLVGAYMPDYLLRRKELRQHSLVGHAF